MLIEVKERNAAFVRQFERLPESVQMQFRDAVKTMAGADDPTEPDFIIWTTAEGMQERCIALVVKGFVNAN